MFPTQITFSKSQKAQAEQLSIRWDDGHEGVITLKTLRDNCPCAGCKGETVLLKTHAPIPKAELPGQYKLVNAHQVGSYALGISWGDGHNTGLYTWEHLRSLCECNVCVGEKAFPSTNE